ncbi:uncharacterized protein LOC112558742 isoform X2 [Pomacea canaliculata]|uniref:uncharacterized protein LOC112558742 isoform X2 n=1 Tax=Pomacea canaliculata TaxID=400727 RepID=UPI000D725BFC|nr:uncharacterized protein LOC112558742 isoform X2 [Pomacea canaliculata]
MKKSRRKNRTRSHTIVDQDEERRKICASIMKVFQAHAQSPSGEGAVLVRDKLERKRVIAQQSDNHQLRAETKDPHSSSSSSSPDSQSQQKTNKEKRRKKKSCKDKSAEEPHSKVSQHLRVAHSYAFLTKPTISKVKNTELASCGGCITRHRLTRNIGLFNPGRKSSTIVRDPIPVPESVQRDVDLSLQKILDHSDVDYETERDDSGMQLMLTPSSHHQDVSCLSVTSRSASSNNGSVNFQDRMQEVPCADSENLFPKTVPYEDFANGMQSELTSQLKKHFTHRDLLRETCMELKKLLNEKQRIIPKKHVFVRISTPQPGSLHQSLSESFSILDEDVKEKRTRSVELVDREVSVAHSIKRHASVSQTLKCSPSQKRSSVSQTFNHTPSEKQVSFSQTLNHSPSHSLIATSETLLAPVLICPADQQCKMLETSQVAKETSHMPKDCGPKNCLLSTVDVAGNDSALSLLHSNSLLSRLNALQGAKEGRMKIHNENCCNLPKRPNLTGASCYNDVTCGQKKYDNAHISRWHKENMRCDKNVKESTFDFGREQHLPPWLCFKKSCVFCEPCQSKAAVAEFCHRPQCTSNFAENLYDSHLMMKDMLPDTSSTKSGACHKCEASEDIDHKAMFSDHQDGIFLDEFDDRSEKRFKGANSFTQLLSVDCDHDLLPPSGDAPSWCLEWKPLDILPPLQKPSLDTPSPPARMSPHKLY